MSSSTKHKKPKTILPLCVFCLSIISGLAIWPPFTFNVRGGGAIQVVAAATITDKKMVVVPTKKIQKITEAHLEIPKINVYAVIKNTGLTSQGAMAVPNNNVDVGWFSLGTRPGEVGSAVIGGHNRWAGATGVFDNLNRLEIGDLVSVVDAKGVSISFVVREIRTFDATDTDSGIFDSDTGAHLNLITCSGVFDPSTKSYNKRLVIFTDVATM